MEPFTRKIDHELAFKLSQELKLGTFEDFYIIPNQMLDLKDEKADLLAIVVTSGKSSHSNNTITIIFDDYGVVNTITNKDQLLTVHSEYAHFLQIPGTQTVSMAYQSFMAKNFGRAYIARASSARRKAMDLNSNVISHWFKKLTQSMHEQINIEKEIKAIPYGTKTPESMRDKYARILMDIDKNKHAVKIFSEKSEYLKEMLDYTLKIAQEYSVPQTTSAQESQS